MSAYTVEEIAVMRRDCERYQLENRAVLSRYSDAELAEIFNGIGPACFPAALRKLLSRLHPSLVIVALIHDLEFHESDGGAINFDLANLRFATNGRRVADTRYGWYDPRRYVVRRQAARFARLCGKFGRAGWDAAVRPAAAFVVLAALLLNSGCAAVASVTAATREKSVAVGSDTWGGGAELTLATPEQPLPTLSGWFGRRRVWYVSVKDRDTGEAAAAVVRAGHAGLSVAAGASGIGLSQPGE